MLKEIIEKLGLKETNETFGQSFMHNVKVYEFESGYRCAAANSDGSPSENGMVIFIKDGKYTKITNEFLLDVPLSAIRECLGVSA
jgi:hypothetical protein